MLGPTILFLTKEHTQKLFVSVSKFIFIDYKSFRSILYTPNKIILDFISPYVLRILSNVGGSLRGYLIVA